MSTGRSKTNNLNAFRFPDHEFDAYLIDQNDRSLSCDCRLWLPKSASEDAHIELWVDASPEIPVFIGPGPLEIRGPSNQGIAITATEVWIDSGPSRLWPARKMARSQIIVSGIGELKKLRLNESSDGDHFFDFALSDCPYLNPQTIHFQEESGKIEIETVASFDVLWPNFGRIWFERRYHYYTRLDINGNIRTSTLSARLENPSDKNFIDLTSTVHTMTDVCLISSLAARQRVLVNEYRYQNDKEISETWSQPLRRYNPSPQGSFDEGLVEKSDFVEYFKAASIRFTSLELIDQMRVREAIYALAPAFNLVSVESEFLALFSALEGLMRVDQPDNGEVAPELWKIAKEVLENTINDLEVNLNDEQRKTMKANLEGLRRPTFRSVFSKRLNAMNVQHSDLWPVFGSDALPGLREIRNLLAHGNRPDSVGSIGVATLHLRVLIERILLSFLGFDAERTKTGVNRVPHCLLMGKELDPLRKSLAAS